ncbi:MAG: YkoF family thiamine/hydroxymethylpyrimidine-binding protein [Spirochaetales bacterium]|uniref:YkoF family thiamine/hydroxymethylpyrimidine-binding protein n=1 Tax=Candidatus Thalassospirochaeta sargassi TaxID=3119039 RepID=A0AAJ1MI59_9SPIO|nr:YkoF family thiamine/hydroxymethylpyrimidine-binding protein [Spirochaetales bacterium]
MKCCSTGIYGAHLGVYPMQDKFADLILNAVKESDRRNLAVLTDDMGTTIQGSRRRVFDYVTEIIGRAFEPEGHTVANLLFSFGCEGDVPETIPADTTDEIITDLSSVYDIPVSCLWSYYPLGADTHLSVIEDTIAGVQSKNQLEISRAHYCTRLDGPLGTLLTALEEAFETSVRGGIHTVFHLTLSKGSPSVPNKNIQL